MRYSVEHIEMINKYFVDLAGVCTLREASRLWGISYTVLRDRCIMGKIAAVQPEGCRTWLLSTRHLKDLYGYPDLPIDPRDNLQDDIEL